MGFEFEKGLERGGDGYREREDCFLVAGVFFFVSIFLRFERVRLFVLVGDSMRIIIGVLRIWEWGGGNSNKGLGGNWCY